MDIRQWLLEAFDRGAQRFQRWFGHDTEMLYYTAPPERPGPLPESLRDVNEVHKEMEISSFGGEPRPVQ